MYMLSYNDIYIYIYIINIEPSLFINIEKYIIYLSIYFGVSKIFSFWADLYFDLRVIR